MISIQMCEIFEKSLEKAFFANYENWQTPTGVNISELLRIAVEVFTQHLQQELVEAKVVLKENRYANGKYGQQWWKGKRDLLYKMLASLEAEKQK